MQVLYVANFDIELKEKERDSREAALIVLEAVSSWILRTCKTQIGRDEFLVTGSRDLPDAPGGNKRSVEWEHVAAGETWATRVERRDVSADDSVFVSRVTVGVQDERCTVRVSMAREVQTSGLTPASSVDLHQPSLIPMLVENDRLSVRVDGQIQDGKYLQVRSSGDVEELSRALTSDTRLPILLLHTRTLEAQAVAQRASSRLIGLVRVVTLDYKATRLLHELNNAILVPYSGGVLVWADSTAAALEISPSAVNSVDRDSLRSKLVALVAPLSVLTRGKDEVFRKARLGSQFLRMKDLANSSAEAAASGSLQQQLEAVIAERDLAVSELKTVTEEWFTADQAAEDSQREVSFLKAQLEQLNIVAEYTKSSEDTESVIELSDAPKELLVGDEQSMDALCQHLERSTKGRITFTPNAPKAWKKAAFYPTLDLMRDSLIKLAEVARDLYDGQERKMGHLDTWIHENYQIKVSLQDDNIPKKARDFDWDGVTRSRIPHVKVNDHVPPSECGRIYFALDNENSRIIVDHIGLHL
ncbi:hypothetical protein IWX65_002704 [Arthrobacter sp. CAN_A214]|uniref:hypothetical protein n=1 Tax=Arthrobacter sp. CAN_A214 TaxID=2787720 RepID=UPI0018CA6879